MRYAIILSLLILSGCVNAGVQVTYDLTTNPPKMLSCHAEYNALFHDSEAANFNVCGGTAETVGSKSTVSLKDLIEATRIAKKAGMAVQGLP